jgi:hypothetical protein
MKQMKQLKVLIIESTEAIYEKIQHSYREVFNLSGYSPEYFGATQETTARKIIEAEWPNVIICDMSLGVESDGLLVLRNLRKDFPDLFFILASKSEYSYRNIVAKKAFFDLFFDKGELIGSSKSYTELCANKFSEIFKINTKITIDESASGYKNDYLGKGELREFSSLLAQVTFTGHDSDTQITPDTVRISKLAGGLSGSKVYRFSTCNSISKLESIPAVLKVSEKEWAIKELNNYNKFVKWGLPYTWRVDVLGSGVTKKYSAVAYSFVQGDTSKQIDTLTYFLENGEYLVAQSVIEKIFSPQMRRWYGDELLEHEENIVHRYLERYFIGSESKNLSSSVFKKICANVYGVIPSGANLIVDGITIGEPIAKLFGTPRDGYLSCICHGDLNSNNVIVSETKEVIFIDFQETGRGHVFEDFVTMESSVRLYGKHNEIDDWHNYLQNEINIANSDINSTVSKPHELICRIRKLAASNFPNEPFINYYYACAAFHFRLLRAKLTDLQQKKCVATIIGALSHF